MTIIDKIKSWYADYRHRQFIAGIVHHYYRAGALNPHVAAVTELYLRRKIEEFRVFASKRYLEDRTLTLDEIKQEWSDLVIKPMAKSEFCREDAKALKAAIVAITDSETFLGEARRVRNADIQQAVAIAKSGKLYTGRLALV